MIGKNIFVVDNNIFFLTLSNLRLSAFPETNGPWSKGMKKGYIISMSNYNKNSEKIYNI
jgi:hypothetical protein